MLRHTKIRFIINLFILIILLYSCTGQSSSKNQITEPNKYFGVQIKNYLPTGSIYIDSLGERQGFRSIEVDITDDTLLPVNLQIEFPNKYIHLFPSTYSKYKVFLLPDSITKENEYDSKDSLSRKLKLFIDKGALESSTLNKIIKPGETHKLRLGFLIRPDGLLRAALFSKGHKHNLFIPDTAITFNHNQNGLELLLGVTLFDDYSIISCGQISFSK